jgi:hypothetical protein
MTRNEIRLALKELEDAYSLRLLLDNRTTVLAHRWSLVDEKEDGRPGGNAGDDRGGKAADGADGERDGLLRVVVGKRQALIAISRIFVIQKVPFGW